jgi:outer membrane lipoprotein-sorting protein
MDRRLFRALLAAALLGLLAGGVPRAQKPGPGADGRLAAILAKMVEVQKGVQTLRVNFTQTNQFAMLAKPQVLKGTLTVQKPATALYAYKSPVALYFRVKDGDLLVYNADKKEAFVQDIRRHEGRIAKYLGITQPMEELQKTFEVTLASVEGDKAYLTLTPTKFRVKEKISAMHFTVGTRDGAVSAFDIVEPGGDKLAFEFQGWEINPKLGEKDFEVPVPPGVKVKRQMLDLKEPFGK